MSVRGNIKRQLRRRGVEVMSYRWTPEARRGKLLTAHVDLLVDVGANVGQYVDEVRAGGWSGPIISMEPLAAAHAELARRAAEDPAWTTLRTAVGSDTGDLVLNVSENDVFSSALPVLQTGKDIYDGLDTVRTETAPMQRLDDLLADEFTSGKRIGVKVDVQGFERDVLDGAEKTLAAAAFWEIEMTPRPLYEGQMLMIEALQRLDDAGLTLVGTENIFTDPGQGLSLQFNGLFVRF